MKFVVPVLGIFAGIVAGLAARKAFEAMWGAVDDKASPKQRQSTFVKVLAFLLVEGAIARLARGLAEHGARHGYAKLTGTWPGEERSAT